MNILIDIGHPAHVHYFKCFIENMKKKGHLIEIVARNKEVTFTLLDYYKLPYQNRGKGKNGMLGKLLYIIKADYFLFKTARKFRPDFFLSAGSPYAAHVSWIMRKPHIALDDTDHNAFQHLLYVPFTQVILTPKVFQKDFGKKHLRFDGFLELGSLHPNRRKMLQNEEYGDTAIPFQETYVILRFVAWNATHDLGLEGLTMEDKYNLVKRLSGHARVVISSEAGLPDDLKPYIYKVHPALMHEVLAGASLLVSESLTMAAEAAFLGTPALCISTAQAGTLDEEVKLGLIELYRKSEGIVERACALVTDKSYKQQFKERTQEIIRQKTDLTASLEWLLENYPESINTCKENNNLLA